MSETNKLPFASIIALPGALSDCALFPTVGPPAITSPVELPKTHFFI